MSPETKSPKMLKILSWHSVNWISKYNLQEGPGYWQAHPHKKKKQNFSYINILSKS